MKIRQRIALGIATLVAASAAATIAAPSAQAGWVCDWTNQCGKVTNSAASKGNLLIYGNDGVQYLLKPGQSSTARGVRDTNKFFAQVNCTHTEYNTIYAGNVVTHTGGGWSGRHAIPDESTNVIVKLISGCPSRGY